MLGRVEVNQGEVIFFGSKYNVDTGTLSFYDPHKINPYLNVSLETTAKGITVVLNVTGPMDKLKLAYTSDPPMQFSDIVSLLATGKSQHHRSRSRRAAASAARPEPATEGRIGTA